MDLFSSSANTNPVLVPLAERMRPISLDDFAGQHAVVAKDSAFYREVKSGILRSYIFWGPPGVGKTTLAKILSREKNIPFIQINAILSNVKEIRTIMENAKSTFYLNNEPTLLFVDEIHRFNKAQQDAFLPYVEAGHIIMIGATTENPSFEVISPLLSRATVLQFQSLSMESLASILNRALMTDSLLQDQNTNIGKDELLEIAKRSGGDARVALNVLEKLCTQFPESKITQSNINDVCQSATVYHDKNGDNHYDVISALQKSIRNSDVDASLYWLGRLLEGGEDPKFIVRRLIRISSEDIGNAAPQALTLAISVKEAVHFLGMPECNASLAQLVIYLSQCPKSNSCALAYEAVKNDIRDGHIYSVPLHLRNAATSLMKNLGYGDGYCYAHNFKDAVTSMTCLPDKIKDRTYYQPKSIGYEETISQRLELIKKKKDSRKS